LVLNSTPPQAALPQALPADNGVNDGKHSYKQMSTLLGNRGKIK